MQGRTGKSGASSAARERPLADCRRAAGLDIYQAAARLRVHHRYLRGLELGRAPLSLDLARRMAVEYGVTLQGLTRPAGASRTGGEWAANGNAAHSQAAGAGG